MYQLQNGMIFLKKQRKYFHKVHVFSGELGPNLQKVTFSGCNNFFYLGLLILIYPGMVGKCINIFALPVWIFLGNSLTTLAKLVKIVLVLVGGCTCIMSSGLEWNGLFSKTITLLGTKILCWFIEGEGGYKTLQ